MDWLYYRFMGELWGSCFIGKITSKLKDFGSEFPANAPFIPPNRELEFNCRSLETASMFYEAAKLLLLGFPNGNWTGAKRFRGTGYSEVVPLHFC